MSDAVLQGRPFDRRRSTRTYDLAARTLGGLWFIALAVGTALPATEVAATPTQILSRSCLVLFYFILGWLLITRPPPKAQADGLGPCMAAFVGTYMPWTIVFVSHPAGGPLLDLIATGVGLLGLSMMVFTILHLGKAFSLVPQARKVVRSGPYRWLRHPLYLAEEIAVLGTALIYLSPVAIAILLSHVAVQVCRIRYEEALLRRSFPTYNDYAASTWRLIPFVW
jgi:protein-S-isoprenylcysteine O-methyltransferase Ste14